MALGYEAEVVTDRLRPARVEGEKNQRMLVPHDAPKFFRDAFANARANKRLLIVDFWASWCGPCLRLKKETFEAENVVKLLDGIEVVFVDLDEHPALGQANRVDAVPDVFLIDRDGFVVDRLRNFEPPAAFAERLKQFRSLSKDWDTLRVVSVEDRAQNELTLVVQPQKGIASLEMNFDLEEQPPDKLETIRISKSLGPRKPSSRETGASNRSGADTNSPAHVTSLGSSIDPLREWFNANKNRPRFITLLSPT